MFVRVCVAAQDAGDEAGALALEISNLGGVYLVLGVGAVFGVFVSLLEMLLGVRERSKENKVDSGSCTPNAIPKRVCFCSCSQYAHTLAHTHNKHYNTLSHAEHRRKRTRMPPRWALRIWAASTWSCSWAAALPACTG